MRRIRLRVYMAWILILGLPVASLADGLSKARPEDLGFSAQRLQYLTDAFQTYVSEGKLAGSVVLVARRGRIAYLRAFGQRDREANAPMPDNAIFRIASQTKALVSVGVMILQEKGRLIISDPVGRYVPGLHNTKRTVRRTVAG